MPDLNIPLSFIPLDAEAVLKTACQSLRPDNTPDVHLPGSPGPEALALALRGHAKPPLAVDDDRSCLCRFEQGTGCVGGHLPRRVVGAPLQRAAFPPRVSGLVRGDVGRLRARVCARWGGGGGVTITRRPPHEVAPDRARGVGLADRPGVPVLAEAGLLCLQWRARRPPGSLPMDKRRC
jgi:hypothetical protein